MSIETVTQPIEYPCSICSRVLPSKQALAGHQFAHRGPEPCVNCGKRFKPGISMARHRENVHGIISDRRAVALKKKSKKEASFTATEEIPDNLDWKADDIFQATLNILWPNGVVPIHALLPLIQWREDTRAFLEKVR